MCVDMQNIIMHETHECTSYARCMNIKEKNHLVETMDFYELFGKNDIVLESVFAGRLLLTRSYQMQAAEGILMRITIIVFSSVYF